MCEFILSVFPILLLGANADSCFTPLGERSECIELYNCALLFSVSTHVPLTSQVSDFLQQSRCGHDETGPKVCCGALPPDLAISNPAEPIEESDSYPESSKECGRDTSDGARIYGGNDTALGEFPWLALLGYRNLAGQVNYKCAGSLINRRYVLTAAHCLTEVIFRKYGILTTVRLGEYDTEQNVDCKDDECADPPQEIAVQAFYPHSGYSDWDINRADDIGLVKLYQRAKYSDYVKPICLVSNDNSKYAVGIAVYVAGWGQTEYENKSPVKLKVRLPIYEQSRCSRKFSSKSVQLTEKQLCAGGEFKKDSCYGDSGGPVMRLIPGDTWEAIGIVSFGYKCGGDGWPAVYTSVVSYLDWIQSKMIETNVK